MMASRHTAVGVMPRERPRHVAPQCAAIDPLSSTTSAVSQRASISKASSRGGTGVVGYGTVGYGTVGCMAVRRRARSSGEVGEVSDVGGWSLAVSTARRAARASKTTPSATSTRRAASRPRAGDDRAPRVPARRRLD
jgi:hypothetical protein